MVPSFSWTSVQNLIGGWVWALCCWDFQCNFQFFLVVSSLAPLDCGMRSSGSLFSSHLWSSKIETHLESWPLILSIKPIVISRSSLPCHSFTHHLSVCVSMLWLLGSYTIAICKLLNNPTCLTYKEFSSDIGVIRYMSSLSLIMFSHFFFTLSNSPCILEALSSCMESHIKSKKKERKKKKLATIISPIII